MEMKEQITLPDIRKPEGEGFDLREGERGIEGWCEEDVVQKGQTEKKKGDRTGMRWEIQTAECEASPLACIINCPSARRD